MDLYADWDGGKKIEATNYLRNNLDCSLSEAYHAFRDRDVAGLARKYIETWTHVLANAEARLQEIKTLWD